MFIFHNKMILQMNFVDNFNFVLAPGFELITFQGGSSCREVTFPAGLNFSDESFGTYWGLGT